MLSVRRTLPLLFLALLAAALRQLTTRPPQPASSAPPQPAPATSPAPEKPATTVLKTRPLPTPGRRQPTFSVPLPRVDLTMPTLQVPQLDTRVPAEAIDTSGFLQPMFVGPAFRPWLTEKIRVPQISATQLSDSPIGKRVLRDVFQEFNGFRFSGFEWQGFRDEVLPKWKTTPTYYQIMRYNMPTIPGHP